MGSILLSNPVPFPEEEVDDEVKDEEEEEELIIEFELPPVSDWDPNPDDPKLAELELDIEDSPFSWAFNCAFKADKSGRADPLGMEPDDEKVVVVVVDVMVVIPPFAEVVFVELVEFIMTNPLLPIMLEFPLLVFKLSELSIVVSAPPLPTLILNPLVAPWFVFDEDVDAPLFSIVCEPPDVPDPLLLVVVVLFVTVVVPNIDVPPLPLLVPEIKPKLPILLLFPVVVVTTVVMVLVTVTV